MNRTFVIAILMLTNECIAQSQPEFVVKKEGIQPIIIRIDSINSEDLFRGALAWAKANSRDGSVTEVEGKSISMKYVWRDALMTHLKTGLFSLDMDFTFEITPGDKQLNLAVSPGPFWIAGRQGKKAEFSYEDLFKKNGEIIVNGLSGKERLEINLNKLASHLTTYLKGNFIVKVKKK